MMELEDVVKVYPYNVLDPNLSIEERLSINPFKLKDILESDLFSIKQKDVITKRFKIGRTLESVGKDYGVTIERIRQIIRDVRIVLSKPKIKNRYTLATVEVYENAQNEVKETVKDLVTSNMNPVEFGDKLNDLSLTRKAYDVSYMLLSTRSYNSLIRSGYKTCFDFIGKKASSLTKIRNIGQKSYNEIIEGLEKTYGIVVDPGDTFVFKGANNGEYKKEST